MEIKPHQNLLYYMERAVDEYRAIFTGFKATYFSELGFFIDSINNLAGNFAEDQTYWQILNSTGPLDVGVSSYVPRDEDSILFNFTVYTNHSSTV